MAWVDSSFQVAGQVEALQVARSTRLWTLVASLAAAESPIEYLAAMTQATLDAEVGLPPGLLRLGLLRLAVCLEDLWGDLDRALQALR